jgi:uncharacterized membrane protein
MEALAMTETGRAATGGANTDDHIGRRPGRSFLAAFLVGIGVAGFIDETVFHQLFHWHHFYDKSSPAVGLVSDGLFHAGSWFATVAGLFLFADLRRRQAFTPVHWWSGFCIGLGGFQLYDGTIQHKLMKLHQIRYLVDIRPYDIAWNAVAAVVVVLGVVLLVRGRRTEHADVLDAR